MGVPTKCIGATDFYPRPPRGGRPYKVPKIKINTNISIHALREEGDMGQIQIAQAVPISIHALREEGDQPNAHDTLWAANFYPRPPRGGRRSCSDRRSSKNRYFYPRPPRGGRLTRATNSQSLKIFLSTPSARRATAKTERKLSAFVSLYTSLHKLQRGACKTNRKITPLLTQTAGIPVRSVPENHVRFLFALAGYQKISTLSCANSGCNPTCSTLVW